MSSGGQAQGRLVYWSRAIPKEEVKMVPEAGQLWEWIWGAFTGTRFLVMEVIPSTYDPSNMEWTLVEIQEFINGGLNSRQITLAALLGNGRPL